MATLPPATPISIESEGGELPSPQPPAAATAAAAAATEEEAPVTMEERQAMIKDITGKATSLVQLLQDYQDQERELRDALLEFVVRDVAEQDRHMQCTRRTLNAQRECLNNAEYVQWALRHGKGEFSAEANALYGGGDGADSAALVAAAAKAGGADSTRTARRADAGNDRALWPVVAGGYMGGGGEGGCATTTRHAVVGVGRGLGEALAGWRSQSTNTNSVAGGSAPGTASLTAALRTLVRTYVANGCENGVSSPFGVWCLNGIPLLPLTYGGGVALLPHLTAKADCVAAAAGSVHASAAVQNAVSAKPEAVVHAWWCAAVDAAAAAARAAVTFAHRTDDVEAQQAEALRRLLFGVEAATGLAVPPGATTARNDDSNENADDGADDATAESNQLADRIRAAAIDSLLRHEWARADDVTIGSSGATITPVIDGASWESPDTLSLIPSVLLKRALLVRVLVVGGFLYGVEPLVPQAALFLELGFRGPREVLNACRAELARLDAAAPEGSLPRNRCLILALAPPSQQQQQQHQQQQLRGESAIVITSRVLDLAPLGPATPMCLFDWRDICAAASQVKAFHVAAGGESGEPFHAVFRGQAQRVVWDAADVEEEEEAGTDRRSSHAWSNDWNGFVQVWVEALRRRVVAPPLPAATAGALASSNNPSALNNAAAVRVAPAVTTTNTSTTAKNGSPGDDGEGRRNNTRSGLGWVQTAAVATAVVACAAPVIARFLRR